MTKAEGGAQFIVANGNLYHRFEEGFAQQGARVAIRPADGQSTMTYAEMSRGGERATPMRLASSASSPATA